MELTYSLDDLNVKVNLAGELDHHSAKKMIDRIEHIIDLYLPPELTLDLGGVTFMDSSGIAVLLGAYRRQISGDGSVRVIGVRPQPMKVLRAAGLSRYMPIEACA